ncbi:MAG: hypothetical protein ACM3XM_17005 [Mycobacterium leprae]
MSEVVNQPHPAETMCIQTTKVYDWCFKNGTFTFTFGPAQIRVPNKAFNVLCTIGFTERVGAPPVETTFTPTCTVVNVTPTANGLAVAELEKLIPIHLQFLDNLNEPIPGAEGTFNFLLPIIENVVICAPTGTNVTCTITAVDCTATLVPFSVASPEQSVAVSVTVAICQEILSTFPVNVCIPVVDFCVPDRCEQNPKPFPCPPPFPIPPQCTGVPGFTPPCPPRAG